MTVQFSASYPTIGLYVKFGLVWADVSSWVRSVSTNRPSSRETGKYQPGTMTVVFDNRDGRFSPANGSSPYAGQVVADIRVRLEATWNGTTYGLFCGYVEDWQDDFPAQGYDATSTMTVIDPLSLLASWEGTPLTAPVGDGETSGARIGRILDSAASVIAPGNRSIMNGDETVQGTLLGGSARALLDLTTDSEGGAYWYDPAVTGTDSFGRFVWESRSALATNTRSTVSQATFSAGSVPFRDPRTSSGRDQLVRAAAYSRVGGATMYASVVGLGSTTGLPRIARSDLVTATDVGVQSIVDLIIDKSRLEGYRVTGLTIDPINDPATAWPKALGLRIRDRATVSMTVPVSSLAITKNVFIDGISHSITPMRWSTSFTFASATAWDAFVAAKWDTATWDGAASKWFY